jgi:outer membrane immunogenic protein
VGSFVLGLALAAIVATPTLAADLPTRKAAPSEPPPACLWCGFYIGGNVGGAWGSSSVNTAFGFPTPPFVPGDVAALSSAASQTVASSGFTGGEQIGYNFQNGPWVWGVEADFDYLGLKGSKSGAAPFPSTLPGGAAGPPTVLFTTTTSVSTNWLITARPRVGWAVDSWLFYATGGLAVGQERFSQTVNLIAPFASQNSFSSTRVGWTAGAGVEYALSRQWSVKGEYLYVDLGKTGGNAGALTPALPIAGTFSNTSAVDLTASIGRVGVNYHF